MRTLFGVGVLHLCLLQISGYVPRRFDVRSDCNPRLRGEISPLLTKNTPNVPSSFGLSGSYRSFDHQRYGRIRSRRHIVSVWGVSRRQASVEYWKGWFPSCRDGDAIFARNALENGVNVDQLDDEVEPGRGKGRTGLQEAAIRGHSEVVGVLLKYRPNLDHQDYWDGRTALMEAAKGGHVEVVRMLIHAGASLDLKDFEGMTAYDWADAYNNGVDLKKRFKLLDQITGASSAGRIQL
mmetsp:Transcript_31032/g.54476  ORF Transcript_31032/g.54476 Transcript_31032/m.54476 type:complete len:237 (-) Transcript_31032:426-1136(-)|eukprot:CAMPEP_0197529724 /NCGR_PEP_ID=MMETSP1318-20131121/29402_1 /TAXON_ID=552666 /ORGANISM="Partenskyella glossopodia, Strain RCC365" /LENGTH=236 /DNA_ID=CAMNT_0043085301 /DNA_START=60 /DNA_END=770 /DNA_ORIENTATION=+